MLEEFHAAQQPAIDAGIGVWSIPGYAHVDHDHGYHYQEESVSNDSIVDKDCGDFSTHAEAQSFFKANGGPGTDPHRLDGNDNDGLVCESL